jgi:hypothetical protein
MSQSSTVQPNFISDGETFLVIQEFASRNESDDEIHSSLECQKWESEVERSVTMKASDEMLTAFRTRSGFALFHRIREQHEEVASDVNLMQFENVEVILRRRSSRSKAAEILHFDIPLPCQPRPG